MVAAARDVVFPIPCPQLGSQRRPRSWARFTHR
jgi:hypothetical protein